MRPLECVEGRRRQAACLRHVFRNAAGGGSALGVSDKKRDETKAWSISAFSRNGEML